MELRWRVGFHVGGEDDCVANFICLLDEFLTWKTKAVDNKVEVFVALPHKLLLYLVGCLFVRYIYSRESWTI